MGKDQMPAEMIIDPLHILVNNRGRVCAHGVPGMGISDQAWNDVAMNERENGTKLS